MRILWISPMGGKYKNNIIKGTGGWIGSLQEELMKYDSSLELGITFPSDDCDVLRDGNVSYFPIQMSKYTGIAGLFYNLFFNNENKEEERLIDGMLKVIAEYNPDVIHVWGIENKYSNLIPYIKIPFIVHIQGFITPIFNSYFSPGMSLKNIREMDSLFKPINIMYRILKLSQYHEYQRCKRRSNIEKEVAPHVKYWMGRTDWDRDISKLLSPQSTYFHCDEIIRSDFDNSKWEYHYDGTLHIQSSISQYWYKGIDVILKTAATLKESGEVFVWNVYGVKPGHRLVDYYERYLGVNSSDVGVVFHGYVDGETIKKSLMNSDVYVHPSNIENSSNAIAEAMMLGVPVVAQFVGGNPTMLKDGSGLLVSQGEPMIMSSAIMKLKDKGFAENLSKKAVAVSIARQNKGNTIKNLLNIYNIVKNDRS